MIITNRSPPPARIVTIYDGYVRIPAAFHAQRDSRRKLR
jgi:hypothetical protein